jgi:hypothetical protein
MDRVLSIGKFRAPLGGQDIELQQVDFEAGGMSLMRIRIREGRRFTVIDIDPGTALLWAEAMQRWAAEQGKSPR